MSDSGKASPLDGVTVIPEIDRVLMASGRFSDEILARRLQVSVQAIMARRAQLLQQKLQLLRSAPPRWLPPASMEIALSRLLVAQERLELVEFIVRERWQRDNKALRRARANWKRERDKLREWINRRPR